jgi:hypothetical protein
VKPAELDSTPSLEKRGENIWGLLSERPLGSRKCVESNVSHVLSLFLSMNTHVENEHVKVQRRELPEEVENTSDNSQFTSKLKEKGDQESLIPEYNTVSIRVHPPMWRVIVTYGEKTAEAQSRSKRAAKHEASRKMFLQLGVSM